MELGFLQPWFAFTAAALAVVAGGAASWKRRVAPTLLLLAAAAMLLSAARPQVGTRPADVRHALIVDVSGSMATRAEVEKLVASLQLPPGHSFVRYELSDALRAAGGPRGLGTDFRRLADIDPAINGEVVLITDGRGKLHELYAAVDPRRLLILRAPAPAAPDAAVSAFTSPASAPLGGVATLRATLRSDQDAEVPWRLLDGTTELASGRVSLRAHVPRQLEFAQVMQTEGLRRLKLVLDVANDRESRNDEASVAISVGTRRRIEYCTPGVEPDALLQMLQSDAANDVRVRATLPADLEAADLVVINNLSLQAAVAAREQLLPLAEWVRAGGSLLMAGTSGVFGPGGYRGSALEEVMPVRFRPEDAPPRRVLLLLDASDSMRESLPGGVTRIARLKEGATRVLESLHESDLATVLGFREGVQGQAEFLPARDARLAQRVAALEAGGATHIATSLEQALDVSMPENSHILLVTDGEEGDGTANEPRYRAIGAKLAARKLRLDIVLTQTRERPWSTWLAAPDVHVWLSEDFDDLLETLDRAVADADRDWILTEPQAVEGIPTPLPRLVRTAPRNDASVAMVLSAGKHPLLARRTIGGRTACLCTDTWGDAALAAFWAEPAFQQELLGAVSFLLEGAGRVNVVLNTLEEGAELVWTGDGAAPAGDLRTSAGVARLDTPGRWLLDVAPTGEELSVHDGDKLLQRIALPRLAPAELRETGDDQVFFTVAAEGGIRVFYSLHAWRPRRFFESIEQPRDITWLPALLGILLLLAGFALRRR